ncbi:IS256 family transposase, partial [Clostridioides difficile]|nr:IS256 family transposase [Clostridioides difficile]
SKSIFPSDDSLHKSLYLATIYISEKWTQILSYLSIYFKERNLNLN